jgi:hypothetical protein
MHRTVTGLALAVGFAAATVVTASAQQYGRYNNPPSGSYQQSCTNVQMRGSTLSASCSANNGQRIYSSLNVNGCNGDVANVNGYLRCNGSYGYNNNGYGSNNGRNDDEDENGNGGHHHHHPNGNAYGYYGNRNGGNDNGYGGNGYGLPPGSYQQSCNNARMNGSTLSASCTATNGQYINSSLDVRRCQSRGTDIANRNGYLSC